MSNKEQHEQVLGVLEWMVAEGMVEKIGDEYRLKTEKEIEKELHEVLAN